MIPYTVNGLTANIEAEEKDLNFLMSEIAKLAPEVLSSGIAVINVDLRTSWIRKATSSVSISELKLIGRGYWYKQA